MRNHRWRAGGLLAAGVLAGGIAAATFTADAATDTGEQDRPRQVRMHAGPESAELAKELGVSEDELRKAFEAIHDAVRPAEPPKGPPSEADRKAMESKLAAELATELGISQDKVKSALAEQRQQMRADRRSALADRLAEAVEDGTLTSDDKASVLKAFDAGVLGGGPHLRLHRR